VLVVSKWAAYQKFIESGAPEITEAGFVDVLTNSVNILQPVDSFWLLNQIPILKPSPIDQSLSAALNLLPLIRQEKTFSPEIAFSLITPFFSSWDHASVRPHFPLKTVFSLKRETISGISGISALWVILVANDFGGSFSAVAEAHRES
jgi:hypothetical protein